MKRSISALIIFFIVFNLNAQTCLKPFRIVILGSSTAAGYGATPNRSWAYLFADSLKKINPNCIIDNLAVGGTTTYAAQADNYVPPAGRPAPSKGHNITKAINLKADAIIINFPSNDVVLNYTLKEQRDNFKRITSEAENNNIQIWVATPQPRNTLTRSQVNRQKSLYNWIMDYYKERAIDFYTNFASEKDSILFKYNAGDGIHLNNKGHRILYNHVMDKSISDSLCYSLKTPIAIIQKPQVIFNSID